MTTREIQPTEPTITKEQTIQIYEHAWNEGQLDDLDKILAPTILRHEPPQLDIVGIEAYKQNIRAMRATFPDLTLRLIDTIIEGTTWAGRWTLEGTQMGPMPGVDLPPSGKHVVMTGLYFLHTRDDLAVEEWIYGDTMGMFQQLGLLPPMQA